MPYAVTKYQTTPNPNALKCILDRSLGETPRSFRSAGEAKDDPLGAALFRVQGVTGLLLSGGWMTVNKAPEADWKRVKGEVEKVLAQAT